MNKFIKIKGKKNFYTYTYNSQYIYSSYNPYREAQKFVDSLTLKKIAITLCGADFVNKALLEKNIPLIISYTIGDFKKEVSSDKLIRVHSSKELENYLLEYKILASDISIITWQPFIKADPSILDILKKIKDIIYKSTLSAKTEEIFSKVEKRNFFHNIIKLDKISVLLKSTIQYNQPAILISSGASLIKYEKFLKNNKNLLVFALPSALPFLFANSIKVDYILAVDPGYGSFYHLIKYKNRSKLITCLTVTPSIFSIPWFEHIIFNYETDHEKKLFSNSPKMVSCPSEGSVIMNSLRILHQIGFKNILLLGQDFSFYKKRMHIKGGSFEVEYLQQSNYFNSLEYLIKKHETTIEPLMISINNKDYKTTLPLKIYFDHFINTSFSINIILPNDCYNPLTNRIKKVNINNLENSNKEIDIITKEFVAFKNFKKTFIR